MQRISWRELGVRGIAGSVVLLLTDTVWGLHAAVDDEGARRRIVRLKRRGAGKGFIILISRLADIAQFEVDLTEGQKEVLRKLWPGRVTVVACTPLAADKYRKLSIDGKTLAFRVPASANLRKLLAVTGPLISTSANLSGDDKTFTPNDIPPKIAQNINLYINSRRPPQTKASTIIQILR